MSTRTAVVAIVAAVAVFGLGVVAATGVGPSVPGPPIRSWLGIGDPPLPDLCEFDPKLVVDPPGEPGPGHWVRQPRSPTPSPEPGAVAIGGYVYLVGGQLRAGTERIVLRFDPRSGKYRREPDAPVAIDHPVVTSHDGEVILASGYIDGADSTDRMWAYSPRTRRWRELPSMDTPRGAAAGATIGDRLYVAGGVSEFGNEYEPYDKLEIYDFKTREWTDGPDMPTPRHHFGAAVVGGRLYAAGGRQPRDQSLTAFEMFDPKRNRWYRLPPLPVGAGSPAVTAIDGRVIVTGGGDEVVDVGEEGALLRSAYAYDPRSREWSRLPDMHRARHGHVAVAVDRSIYVFRGAPCPGYGEMASVESLPASEVR
jgi:hypothetical protein